MNEIRPFNLIFETISERKPKLYLSTNHSNEVLKVPFEDLDLGTILHNKLINSDEHFLTMR